MSKAAKYLAVFLLGAVVGLMWTPHLTITLKGDECQQEDEEETLVPASLLRAIFRVPE